VLDTSKTVVCSSALGYDAIIIILKIKQGVCDARGFFYWPEPTFTFKKIV
jgi:hypothetical protein